MNQTIDEVYIIIQLLKMIDEDETIDVKEKHPLIDAVIYLADEHLTGNENFKNIVNIIYMFKCHIRVFDQLFIIFHVGKLFLLKV